jgi:hypothetical protein
MFEFLAASALFGLGLLIIPVLLHIFKPRKVRQTPFSSLRWLRDSKHRISRRIHWHQVVLLLLRAAFISLLVLALARPIMSLHGWGEVSRRFVILDVGRSMNYQDPDGPAPIEVGKRVAEQFVVQAGAGDRTTILLAGKESEALGPLVGDAGVYLPRVRAASPAGGSSDFSGTLRIVRSLIKPGPADRAVELNFITDNRAHNWSQSSIRRLLQDTKAPVRVTVVDVGPELVQNAWIADARLMTSAAPMRRAIRIRLGAVGDQIQPRTVRLTGLEGLADSTELAELRPDDYSLIEFEIPAEYVLSGKVAEIRIEPSDALAGDDVYWLNLDSTAALNLLMIEPESSQIESLQPGFHLRTALASLYDVPGTLELVRRGETAILESEIAQADVIVMVDVAKMSPGNVEALEKRVRHGAGLLVFLGPSIDRGFYNTAMHNPRSPSTSLLPVLIKDRVALRSGAARLPRIAALDRNHPVLAHLLDPIYGDLAGVQFSSFHQLEPVEAGQDVRALASIGHQAPAILERSLGAGKVILLNTTASDGWSDFPRRKSYVPVIDRLIGYLSGGLSREARRGMFPAGEVVTMPLPPMAHDVEITVETPDGKTFQPSVSSLAGRPAIQMGHLTAAGIYRVKYARQGTSGEGNFPLVVNEERHDSPLRRISKKTLEAWWKPAELQVITPDRGSGTINLVRRRLALEPWLVLTACVVLWAEMFLVHWLCPKTNPHVVSSSIVARHGMFGSRTRAGGNANRASHASSGETAPRTTEASRV